MTRWREVKIGDVGRVVTGRTPSSSQPELFGDAYPFITPTDIDGQERRVATARFISEAGRASMERLVLPAETIAYVCIASVGKVCMVDRPSVTNQQINAVVVDQAQHDASFVFYALRDATPRILAMVGGAATPIINKSAFSEVTLRVPCLAAQRHIASVLAAYDDLIENNKRRVAILEEMARRIYEEWFVRFRFPGFEAVRMVESELGLVPEGWRVTRFTDVFDVRYGKGLGTKDLLADGQYPVYGAGGVIGRYNGFVADGPTCLITSRGNGSGTVWRTVEKAFVTNNSFLVYPKAHFTGLSFGFAEIFAGQANVKTVVSGSAQPQLTIDGLAGLKVIAPERDVLVRFDALVSPMFDLANRLHFVRRNLRATRDLLLPKLISGELDVSAVPEPEALAA